MIPSFTLPSTNICVHRRTDAPGLRKRTTLSETSAWRHMEHEDATPDDYLLQRMRMNMDYEALKCRCESQTPKPPPVIPAVQLRENDRLRSTVLARVLSASDPGDPVHKCATQMSPYRNPLPAAETIKDYYSFLPTIEIKKKNNNRTKEVKEPSGEGICSCSFRPTDSGTIRNP